MLASNVNIGQATDPSSFDLAISHSKTDSWAKVLEEELKTMQANDIWILLIFKIILSQSVANGL